MDWFKEHWGTLLSIAAGYSTTLVGIVMYVRNQGERITVVETKVEEHSDAEEKRLTDLKSHVDGRFDRIESRLDSLFIPRGERGMQGDRGDRGDRGERGPRGDRG